MTFDSDLRAGYGTFEFNFAYYAEYLGEREMQLINLGETPEEQQEYERDLFSKIDKVFTAWCVYKVFNHKQFEMNWDAYDSVYELIDDTVVSYTNRYPNRYKRCGVDDAQ